MPDMCPRCGLPKELCVCDILDREATKRIKVYKVKMRIGEKTNFLTKIFMRIFSQDKKKVA